MSPLEAVVDTPKAQIVNLSDVKVLDLGIDIDKIPGDFLNLQALYATRNDNIDAKIDLFEGEHWEAEKEDETQYQLVLNYIRNAVLRYASILSRKPLPRVPYPGAGTSSPADVSANKCERYLHSIWPDLWAAWRDVELDACKVGYGVLQIVWAPQAGQPETIDVGQGAETFKKRAYITCPFKPRPVPPKRFYPVYRTFDKPNDFQAVYRYDPGRLIVDLEEQYGVSLQPTGYGPMTENEMVYAEPTCDLIELWTAKAYVLTAKTHIRTDDLRHHTSTEEARYAILTAGANPHTPFIPFWVLQNIRSDAHKDPTNGGSLADMDDLGELVKHLEEMESEHAQEVATHIHSPVVYKSEEHLTDPSKIKFTPGAVFPIGIDEELDTMDWNPDPAGITGHLERIFGAIQDLSFLGEAGFGRLAAGMSGIGFKIALTPMEQILELKTPNRIKALQDIGAFLLTEFRRLAKEDTAFRGWVAAKGKNYGVAELLPEEIGSHPVVEVSFGNLLPRDEYMHQQNEVYKYKAGSQSLLTTLDNMGVEDSQLEQNRIRAELQDEVLHPDHAVKLLQLASMKQQQQAMKTQQPQSAPGGPPGGPGGGQPGGGMPGGGGQPGGGPQQFQISGFRPQVGGGQPGANPLAGPAGAVPGTMQGGGMPGGPGGMQALMQSLVGGQQQGAPGGAPPMMPPGMTGGPNTPPPEEETARAGRLAPFLPRR